MNILKIEIERDGNIQNSKQMPYSSEKEFFTALVTLCDVLSVEVPIWSAYEERILKKSGHFKIAMENGGDLRISSYSE